jgi:very-short-patch-repair endonuclease
VAPDLLGDEREHRAGRMRSRDERRHAAQRLLLPQTRTQRALEALVLNRELGGIRLRRMDSPIAHGAIVPRMRGARK